MDILKINDVSKNYVNHLALDHVSFNVPAGCVYGLLGPNGAGKTTLLRIINHITAPDTGVVEFDGHVLCQNDVAHIGYLPEERGLYKKMRVGEQAVFFARLKGLSRAEAVKELKAWFERLEISDWWNRKVEELSKGMAQKVQFIITVLHRPKLLIFDEPFSGFDPINANLLKEEILRLKDQGSTVIFSTHNMSSVEAICDSITLINQGQNILSGNVEDIRRSFAQGRYVFTIDGAGIELMPLLGKICSIEDTIDRPHGHTDFHVKLHHGVELRDAIALVNDSASLVGLNEAIASMDDIFINSVNEFNKLHQK